MSAGDVVFIEGVTGFFAACINGPYSGTSESSGGYALFHKRGDGSMLMEHYGGQWQVKPASDKGKAPCMAYVAGGCAPAVCASPQWMVSLDGKVYVDAPDVKMVTGAEAARKVSGCCVRAHEHADLPPLPLPVVCCDACCAGR
jgi:hypothetical protein